MTAGKDTHPAREQWGGHLGRDRVPLCQPPPQGEGYAAHVLDSTYFSDVLNVEQNLHLRACSVSCFCSDFCPIPLWDTHYVV